jgi:sulfofructose kinase
MVLEGLRREGVDVSRAQVVGGARTPISFVQVHPESGERTIYHKRGPEVSPEQIEDATEGELDCDAALVDGAWPEASGPLAQRARQAGIPVVGDFCPTGGRESLAGVVEALIVPGACAEQVAPGARRPEQLRMLRALGPPFVAVTAGAEGCWYLREGKAVHQPAFAVDVVDTTGAGDVFHGAFAYALARRWAPDRAVELAGAAAALSCRALGGRKAIPALGEALAFLRAHGSPQWAE